MQRFDLKSFRIDRKLTKKELAELLMLSLIHILKPHHVEYEMQCLFVSA